MLLALVLSSAALASEWQADLQRPGKRIGKLAFESEHNVVFRKVKGGPEQPVAVLKGTYSRPFWSILAGNRKLKSGPDGAFALDVPLTANQTKVKLIAVGPQGELEEEQVVVQVTSLTAIVKERSSGKSQRRYNLSPGLSITSITYAQTRVAPYTATALSAKISLSYWLSPPRWDLGVSAYGTVYPLTSSNPESTLRFVGVNFRVGYGLPFISEPWRVSLMGGWYYTTTFVTQDRFGFQHLQGPQLFPTIRRSFGSSSAAVLYFKLSPITDGFTPLSLKSRELAAGGAYTYRLSSGKTVSATLDVASLKLTVSGLDISSNSVSIGAAFGL